MPDTFSVALGAIGTFISGAFAYLATRKTVDKSAEVEGDKTILEGFKALFEAQNKRIADLTVTVVKLTETVDDLNSHIDDLTDTLRKNGIAPPPRRRRQLLPDTPL